MGRRKKEVLEMDATEELDSTNEESAQNESDEAELLNDSQTRSIAMSEVNATDDVEEDSTTAFEVEAKEDDVKPKRQRRSRKKADETDAVGTEITSETKTDETKTEKNLKKEMDAACKAIDNSMDSMLKQWSSVKEVTASISKDLEKIANQVQSKTGQSLDEFLLPKKEEKPSFLVKFAICASVIATLFSVLSLTMSQTARQAILNAEISRTSSVQNASNLSSTPEVAFSNYKRTDRRKK